MCPKLQRILLTENGKLSFNSVCMARELLRPNHALKGYINNTYYYYYNYCTLQKANELHTSSSESLT